MQKPMDSYICALNTSTESIFTFCSINAFMSDSSTPLLRVNLTKRENFLTSYLYHRRRNPYVFARHRRFSILFLGQLFFFNLNSSVVEH